MAAGLFKDIEAAHARHFDVEEENSGKRKLLAVSELALGLQIADGLLTVRNDLKGFCKPMLRKARWSSKASFSLSSAMRTVRLRFILA